MHIDVGREAGTVVVRPVGRLDTGNGPALEGALQELISGGEARLVVDLGSVDYVSSAGLGVLLKSARLARAGGGRVVLCGLRQDVLPVFEVSGFLKLFEVHPTAAEAAGGLEAESGRAGR